MTWKVIVLCTGIGARRHEKVWASDRMQPSAPDGLSIQFPSANGYILSWGEATGLVTGSELYEATQPDFSNQVLEE